MIWTSILTTLLLITPAPDTTQETSSQTWTPATGIPEEEPIRVQFLALDASKSVQGTERAPLSEATLRYALHETDRAYTIIAMFGTYPRIVTERYLDSPTDRRALIQAAEQFDLGELKGIGKKTDVAALERLIETVRRTLISEYPGRRLIMKVSVISDGKPDPIDPEANQSFKTLLSRPTSRISLGGGLYAFTITSEYRPAPAPPSEDSTESDSTSPGATSLTSGQKWGLVGAAVLLALTGLVFLASGRDDERLEESTPADVSELVVEEWDCGEDTPTQVGSSAHVPVQHEVPITIGFGSECVVPLSQLEDSERSEKPDVAVVVTPQQEGMMTISPRTDDLKIDEAPLEQDVTVSATAPHSITGDGWEVRLLPEQKSTRTFFTDLINQS